MEPSGPLVAVRRAALAAFEGRRVLYGALLLNAATALLVWFSGSPLGTYGLECSIGVIGHDLAHGLNPHVPLLDYFDTFTGSYLTSGVIAAPFTLLPWPAIYAVKLSNLLLGSAVLVLAWAFLWRNVGPAAARVGVVALALAPPVARHHGLIGTYHWSGLAFDTAMLFLIGEIATARRRHPAIRFGFGLVCGYAITHCFGSAAAAAVVLLAWWAADRPRFASALAVPAGILAGLLPLLAKGTFHRAYHVAPRGLREFGYSHAGALSLDPGQLARKVASLLGGDYGDALGFIQSLSGWLRPAEAQVFARAYAVVTVLSAVVVLVLGWKGMVPGLRGLVLRSRPPDEREARLLVRLLPTLFALAYLAAYACSNQFVPDYDEATSQFRDNRFLPPLAGYLAIALGIAVQQVVELLRGRGAVLRRATGVILLAGGAILGTGCLLAQLGMVDWPGLAASHGIPYRGRCYAIEGFFAAEVVGTDRAWATRLCDGFPEEGRADCMRGWAWGAGSAILSSRPPTWEEIRDARVPLAAVQACEELGADLASHCVRQLGWQLAMRGPIQARSRADRLVGVRDWCQHVPGEDGARLCIEGIGFAMGDHYAFDPGKLQALFPAEKVGDDQSSAARGIGYLFGYNWEDRRVVDRLCARYAATGPGLDAACMDGAAESRSLYRE